MKKYLIIIIVPLIGAFLYFQIPVREMNDQPEKIDEGIHIQLNNKHILNWNTVVEKLYESILIQLQEFPPLDRDSFEEKIDEGIYIQLNNEHILNWDRVAEILQMCCTQGFTDVAINDFRWHYHVNEWRNIPHYKETDTLVIQKKDIGHSRNENSSTNMSLDDQYKWDLIHAWCKRNGDKHAMISFGGSVTFDALEEVVRIFDAEGVTFDLAQPDDSSDPESRSDIKLELFTHRNQEQMPDQSSEPTSLDAHNYVDVQSEAAPFKR